MPEPIEVAILVVSYNSRAHLEVCLASVLASDDGCVTKQVVVADNNSQDGSEDFVAERFPTVDLLRLEGNEGFTGGNNRAWEHVQQRYPQVKYVYLLNPDTQVTSGFLAPLVSYLEAHPEAGCLQSKMLLFHKRDHLNSAGNRSHYLGFGFVTAFNEKDEGQYDRVQSIDYASGAAVIIRASLLRELGLFDEAMFLYLEDADISWKLRAHGHDTCFMPESIVYHKYEQDTAHKAYEHLERNRWRMLLVYYRLPTLIAILPMLLAMEMGQLLFAMQHGYVRRKLRACGYYVKPSHLREVLARRRAIQRGRVIGDRELVGRCAGRIEFPHLSGFLIDTVMNPVLDIYWRIVRRLLGW